MLIPLMHAHSMVINMSHRRMISMANEALSQSYDVRKKVFHVQPEVLSMLLFTADV